MRGKRTDRLVRQLLAAAAAFAIAGPVRADYTIQSGDVLEVSVVGLPEARQRSTVGIDGELKFFSQPPFRVAGSSLAAAETQIKDRMSRQLYQLRMPDGRESSVVISPDAVSLAIVEYCPVYLNGDVSRPGAQAYRPGMTVRQAIALAGGFEIMRFRMTNPFLESADLRTEFENLWLQHAREQSRIWRIKMELDPKAKPSLDQMTTAPLADAQLTRVREAARKELELRNAQLEADLMHLQDTIRLTDDQLSSLRSRQQREGENIQVDQLEYTKLKEFSEKGNLPMTRLAESRRMVLFSYIQALQTEVQATNARRDLKDVKRRLDKFIEDRRLGLVRELSEAEATVDGIRTRLQSTSEKITYTGMIRSQLTRGKGSQPMIYVVATTARGGGKRQVDEETELFPGDTVEVALQTGLSSADVAENR
ncbi:polysaccharide biosynthesis/export family protein [Methylobacterium oxalidis]|uniref:polysaccharide biosynthesis/export family protein n=1 Tax=Methylobacterium oxalidis TaxID=944322 RepID=UPI003314ABE7